MSTFDERVWHLELVEHWLGLNAELADLYRRTYLRDEELMRDAEESGTSAWLYVDPEESQRIMDLQIAITAFSEFGISA